MSKISWIVIVLAIYLCVARDIYIAQSRGNDETGTGSNVAPYRTFQKALSLVVDGDKIKAEIGIYQHTSTIDKAITVEGIREHSKLPVFSGLWNIRNVASFAISNLEVENPGGDVFSLSKVADATFTALSVGPASGAMTVRGGSKTITISDCVFTKLSTGPSIGSSGSDGVEAVVIKNSKFIGITRGGAFHIYNSDRVSVEGVEVADNCVGYSAQCGMKLSYARNFMITNSKVTNAETGAFIEQSTGSIENTVISGINRVYSSYGGGIYLLGSTVRTRMVSLLNNKANIGAGFYCSGGSLNMFMGKIEGNAAATAGGAGECSAGCAFFMDQTIVRENTQTKPSSCRGL